MMLPDEYEKFRSVVKEELDDEFFYQSRDTDPAYHSLFDKIRLKGTVFDTHFSRQFPLRCHGIFIDIFVHDHICKGPLRQKYHIFKTLFVKSLVHHKWGGTPMHFYGKLKFICRLATIYKDHRPIEALERLEIKTVTKYNRKNTHLLYDGRGEHTRHGSFDSSILEEGFELMLFNGMDFPVPIRYNDYLKFSYGDDYMELPPEEKRQPGHDLAVLDFGKY